MCLQKINEEKCCQSVEIKQSCCGLETTKIKEVKYHDHHIHDIVCSASCDHEEHERLGFSTSNFVNFSKEDVFALLDDSIKTYIDLQGTLF